MRIAVIGAGISGLAASYWLGQQHDVELYEAAATLGGHAHTVDIEHEGEHHAIDTGFVVFNDWTYPNFCRLLDELAIESEPTSMSFSVRHDPTGLEYNGTSLNGLFAQRKNLWNRRFWGLLGEILRFNRLGNKPSDDSMSSMAEQTVAQFLKQHRFSAEFTNQYLLPMASAIWSCPTGVIENFPIAFILEFYRNHGLLNVLNRPTWRIIKGGSRTYVEALRQKLQAKILLNRPVKKVVRTAADVRVCSGDGQWQTYDHVVMACHSDQALALLDAATPVEQEVLSAFRYEENELLLHLDPSVLPKQKRAWASWNYWVPESESLQDSPPRARLTYNLNILQKLRSERTYCLSLNCEQWIDSATVLKTFNYAHPVFTLERERAQARHRELINQNRTSYAGAYWRNGFHEDGVWSALAVCTVLNSAETIVPAPHPYRQDPNYSVA